MLVMSVNQTATSQHRFQYEVGVYITRPETLRCSLAVKVITGYFVHDGVYSSTLLGSAQSICNATFHSVEAVSLLRSVQKKADRNTVSKLPPRFGLKDSSPARWDNFADAIADMNARLDDGAQVKVFWLARHGEGHRALR